VPTERTNRKLADRVREVASAPPRRAAADVARPRAAERRAPAAPSRRAGAAEPGPGGLSFEFGSLAVGAPPAREVDAPRPPAATGAAREVSSKAPGAPAAERGGGPATPAVKVIASPTIAPAPPTRERPRAPEAGAIAAGPPAVAAPAPAHRAATAAPEPAANLPAPAAAAPAHAEADLEMTPMPPRGAPAGSGAGGWAQVFEALGAVTQAVLARVDASRAVRAEPPRHDPVADRAASDAREREDLEWSGRLDALRRAAVDLLGSSADARQAALGAERRPDAAAAAPFAAEAARLGEAAQAIAAALAAARSAREALRSPLHARAHAEALARGWAELEGLLARLQAGTPVPPSAAEAAAAGVRGEVAAAGEARGGALLGAAAEIRSAFREVGAAAGAAPPGTDARLDRAAALAAGREEAAEVGPAAPPLPASPSAPPAPAPSAIQPAGPARALRDEGHETAPAEARREREGKPRRERPATWELRVARSSTEVRLADVARVLGVARLEDVRDVLREGLATRHQFVLWTRVGTTLDDALRAAVDAGLVETRTEAPERSP
jgi:hypothetical protein